MSEFMSTNLLKKILGKENSFESKEIKYWLCFTESVYDK
jgi:hypothetical protein